VMNQPVAFVGGTGLVRRNRGLLSHGVKGYSAK
jgi:hypothetical protein